MSAKSAANEIRTHARANYIESYSGIEIAAILSLILVYAVVFPIVAAHQLILIAL